ncbi:preprotein translocase subunit SecE [Desulfococcaceae bacterium HSG9]|nr:preprotein translocase subunit SecE [Desulfococcaceae bacterium HSG9]
MKKKKKKVETKLPTSHEKGTGTGSGKKIVVQSKKPIAIGDRGKILGYLDLSIQFLREVKIELKKVTWPSRKQTMGSSTVVIILVLLISLFLFFIDSGLAGIIRLVLHSN